MGIFNGFICDRCGKEFRSNSTNYNPVSISLKIAFGRTLPSSYEAAENKVWCRECVMKTGLDAPANDEDKKIAPEIELTFEEKFSMMIEALGFIKD